MLYKKILNNIKKNNIYNYLIKLSKKLPYYPNKYKKEKYILKNCVTKVWLFLKYKNKKIFIFCKSESKILNGILYLIIKTYSNKYPSEIINDKKNNIFNKINFNNILSINRYIGILYIIKNVKLISLKFKNKKN